MVLKCVLWQDLACRGSNKERAGDKDRRETIWEQTMSVEQERGEEIRLQNNLDENTVGPSFLAGEPPPKNHKGFSSTGKAHESMGPNPQGHFYFSLSQAKIRPLSI